MSVAAVRGARRLAPVALVAALCMWSGTTKAVAPFPLVLQEPQTGRSVELKPGAAALHIVFFATWCPPCLDELERLAVLEERWRERGYRLALIAVRHRNTPQRLLQFARQHHPPGTVYLDASGEAQRAFAADDLPAHVLVDAAGREVGRWSAMGGGVEDAVRDLLRSPSDGS